VFLIKLGFFYNFETSNIFYNIYFIIKDPPQMFSAINKKIKFFKKCDIFGYPVTLTMKNESTYKTVFGGFLTIILIIFFFCVIIYSFYMLFTKQTLQTNKYELNLGANYGFLNLTDQDVMIAILFDDNNLNNWTHPYINVTMEVVTQYRNSTTVWKTKTPIKLKPCTYSDFPGLNQDFDQLLLSTALCPVPGTKLPLQGDYQETVFTYWQIVLTSCTNRKICQSNETIYQEISSLGIFKNIRKLYFYYIREIKH